MNTESRLQSLEERVDRLEKVVAMFQHLSKQMETMIELQKETNRLLRNFCKE